MNAKFRYTFLAASLGLLLGTAYAQEADVDIEARAGAEIGEEQHSAQAEHGDKAARREEIQRVAEEAVAELEQSSEAAVDVESAHGYAVFDTTKGGLVVTGAGGTGIAKENGTGEETFMHLGAGGVGLGAGIENYKLVLVFHDESTYDQFVDGQWSGGISGQAVAGEAAASAEAQALEGVDVYRLSDEGLIAQADLTGMRFWPSEELNEDQS